MFSAVSQAGVYLITLVDTNPLDHTGLGVQTNQQLAALLGILTPLAVALITKRLGDSPRTKALLLLAFNLLVGFLTEFLGDGEFHWQSAAWGVILAFVTGGVALYLQYKPLGVSDSLHNVLRKD